MTTYYVSASGGNNTILSTWKMDEALTVNATVLPTAGDDVFFVPGSGNINHTQDAQGTYRNLIWLPGATGQYVMNSANRIFTITGDFDCSQAVNDNPLVIVSTTGMSMQFAGTSAQSVNFGGKPILSAAPFVIYVGASTAITGTEVNLTGAVIAGVSTGTVNLDVRRGIFRTNGNTILLNALTSNNSNTRTIDLGTSNITLTAASGSPWNTGISTGLTFTGDQSYIIMNGGSPTFDHGSIDSRTNGRFGTLEITSNGNATIGGGGGFCRFNHVIYQPTGKGSLLVTQTQTWDEFTITGSREQRATIRSSAPLAPRSITCLVVNMGSDVNFRDITMSGAGWAAYANTGNTKRTGDALGNTGTPTGFFATSRQLHAVNTGGGSTTINLWSQQANWSLTKDGAGGEGPPLPQDDVYLDSELNSTVQMIRADAEYIGRDIIIDGRSVMCTGSPTLCGSITLTGKNNATIRSSSTTARFFYIIGRDGCFITTNGQLFGVPETFPMDIVMQGGVYTLLDSLHVTRNFNVEWGYIHFAGNTLTCAAFTINSSGGARGFVSTVGSTLVLTGSGQVLTLSDAGAVGISGAENLTVIVSNSTGLPANTQVRNIPIGHWIFAPEQRGQFRFAAWSGTAYSATLNKLTAVDKHIVVAPNVPFQVNDVSSWSGGSFSSSTPPTSGSGFTRLNPPEGSVLDKISLSNVGTNRGSLTTTGFDLGGNSGITFPEGQTNVRGTNSYYAYTTGTLNVPIAKPAATVEGDLMLMWVSFDNITVAPTIVEGGWEEVVLTDNGDVSIRIFSKIAGPSEPAEYTVNTASSNNAPLYISYVSIGNHNGIDNISLYRQPDSTLPAGNESLMAAPIASNPESLSLSFTMFGNGAGVVTSPDAAWMNYIRTGTTVRGIFVVTGNVAGDGQIKLSNNTAVDRWASSTFTIKPVAVPTESDYYVRMGGILIPVQDRYRYDGVLHPIDGGVQEMVGFESNDFESADFE